MFLLYTIKYMQSLYISLTSVSLWSVLCCAKQVLFQVFIPQSFILVSLTENVGLSEREEGCGLFSKSCWIDAIMQVTTYSYCLRTETDILSSVHYTAGLDNRFWPLIAISLFRWKLLNIHYRSKIWGHSEMSSFFERKALFFSMKIILY